MRRLLLLLTAGFLLTACTEPEVLTNPIVSGCAPEEAEPVPTSADPEFVFQVTNKAVYKRGETHTIDIFLQLDDPAQAVESGVYFLAIVENDGSAPYPPVAGQVLDREGTQISSDIFRKPHCGANLRAGLMTQFTIKIKDDAKPADYFLNFQLFEGTDTNPSSVSQRDRIAAYTASGSVSFTVE